MTAVTRAVGYVRVSTGEQGESGLGLKAQVAAVRAACEQRGWELVSVREEVKSGSRADNRPVLVEVLASLRCGEADAVVVAKLDRLSRSVVDAGRLLEEARKRGFNIVALDLGLDLSTPTGELVANVLAAVAQWERRMIGVRTSEAMQVKIRAAGGHPPGSSGCRQLCGAGSSGWPMRVGRSGRSRTSSTTMASRRWAGAGTGAP